MISYKQALRHDISSGLVVFLVALPLCLGIALASGAPFFSGIIAGIVGGIVIGSLSNSHVSVSGPAAGLATIVFAAIATLGSFEVFLAAVVLAGILQLIMGFAKIGSIAEYFPSAVIRGMLTSIGIIIILKQIPHGLGYDQDVAFLNEKGLDGLGETLSALAAIHPGATALCVLSLVVLVLWEKPFIKKRVGLFPGALAVVLLGVMLNEFVFPGIPDFRIMGDHLVKLPVPEDIAGFIGFFSRPDFSAMLRGDVMVVALTLAIIASIETLLCIEAGDKLDKLRRTTSTNRELLAQGVGNIISGLIGGLPVTSVIVRTSTNIHAGAKTKLSAIIHGVLLLLTVLFIPTLLNRIPLAVLAAILLVVGYKLASPSIFRQLYKRGYAQFLPFMVTVVAVVLTDLLSGVAIGFTVALILVLRQNLIHSLYRVDASNESDKPITLRFAEEVSFLNKAAIRRALDHVPEGAMLVVDARHSVYIDPDVLELLREFKEIQAPSRNISFTVLGIEL